MNEKIGGPGSMDDRTTVERRSERELAISRTIKGPARLVYAAWARPELFQRWWAPRSFGMTVVSYEADVRTGGGYHLVMAHPASEQPMSFFGKYVEVTPPTRIVWTNDEGDAEGPVTTVTFGDDGGETLVVLTERYPSSEALDEAVAAGSTSGCGEQFEQLEALVAGLPADFDAGG